MCGIAGFFNLHGIGDAGVESLRNMTKALAHRGPDDEDFWCDTEAGVALGHRRLSILDLSSEGRQPMISASGRYVIVYNGEIYNYRRLRSEMAAKGYCFRGSSDTEVLLALIEEVGLERALARLIGMFAFALWDRKARVLQLVRDHIGIKPLYYGSIGNTFLFGSELKAFKAHSQFQGKINRGAVALLLRYRSIPAPYSIYENVFKLMPGCVLTIHRDALSTGQLGTIFPYWSADKVASEGLVQPFAGDEKEAVDTLEVLLRDAVVQQMIADVPLGAFLSGGIDSSTVVALMQAQSNRPVKTFTIGFWEKNYNEAEYAKGVARHLGTDHTELYVTPEEAMAVIPELPTLYDEPFSGPSQIPTFLVSRLARRQVTVALSGDGGDELFGGYNRYFWGRAFWDTIGWMPTIIRQMGAKGLRALTPGAWERVFEKLAPVLPSKFKPSTPADKLHKLADILAVKSPEEMYFQLVSDWKDPATVVRGTNDPSTPSVGYNLGQSRLSYTERMMLLDLISYLPDHVLVKVDRASMGASLEARVPLLDQRVVEFAWRLPLSMKIHKGQGKWILRQVLYKYVPKQLIERQKKGFGLPIDSWLRGPLREWAENLLDEERLRQEGFFNPQPIRQKWNEHSVGKRNWQYHLWDVLMFQAWLEAQ